ncbi:MAG: DUF488 domain-containing protein [Chloroflexi bacterium]|nr:DUF488 domain-containing protein [Chloroflexota bacterium]
MAASPLIYTIGHSNHTVEELAALLRGQGVTIVVDVRSQPYSRWTPQFNKQAFSRDLQAAGLTYLFMGDSLGGRPDDPALQNAQGHPDYERMAATPAFQSGLERLQALAVEGNVAILCSEGDYRACHRSLLIAPHLLERGVRVVHILPDGQTVEAGQEPRQLSLL